LEGEYHHVQELRIRKGERHTHAHRHDSKHIPTALDPKERRLKEAGGAVPAPKTKPGATVAQA
jgi:hypothetical protein